VELEWNQPDEWRCDFYDISGQSEVDEDLRCVRLAVRWDPATGRHWCDIEWHDA
jgi:hypothetical protein